MRSAMNPSPDHGYAKLTALEALAEGFWSLTQVFGRLLSRLDPRGGDSGYHCDPEAVVPRDFKR